MMYDPNNQEQESCATSLHNNNFENDLDNAIADTKIKANQIYGGCVYSNIDNRK